MTRVTLTTVEIHPSTSPSLASRNVKIQGGSETCTHMLSLQFEIGHLYFQGSGRWHH